jgi:16S rRNA (cytidine1402-2'-O)-methyltransferase
MLHLLGINRYDPKDIAPRVIETLVNSHIIFGEHEDAAKEFMKMVGVDYSNKEVYEVNASNEGKYSRWAVEQVRLGKDIAFLTGDGYPVITDPGYVLVNTFIQNGEELRVYPQVSAIASSVILSGYLGANNETFFYGGMLDFMTDKMKLEAKKSEDVLGIYLFQGTYHKIPNLIDIYGPERDAVICIDMGHDTQKIIRTKVGLLFAELSSGYTYATFVVAPRDRESFFNIAKMPNNVLERGNLKKIGEQQKTNYIHNSSNFRCDEFRKDHDKGLHILFSGCSNTWPQAIDEDKGWAKQIYNKLNKEYNLNGYYNLAIPGASISEICQNVMSYCQVYGKPNVIFLNLPDANREAKIPGDLSHKNEYTSFEKQEYADKEYERLQGYCSVNNILLITFSWTDTMLKPGGHVIAALEYLLGRPQKHVSISKDFNTYKKFDINDFKNYVVEYFKNNPDDHDADVARDADHPGHAVHWAWYNCLYEMFTKNPEYLGQIESYKKVQQGNQA